MTIKIFSNDNAKKYVKNSGFITHIEQNLTRKEIIKYKRFINCWFNEIRGVKCYVLLDNDSIKTIILISKMDYDPQQRHENPFNLNLIYTFPNYRKKNYAYNMLMYLKDREQITAFTDSIEGEYLFKKANFIQYKDETPGYNMFCSP